ncbi:hypothetical protein D3C80_739410 [compost metagenome]
MRELLDILDTAGHICREFDDLEHPAVEIEDRIVGGLDEDLAAALAQTHEFICHEIAAGEPFPELPVLHGLRIGRFAEHRMVPALHFRQRITQRRQKILVGRQDLASGRKLNDGLRPREGVDLARIFRRLQLAPGDIGGDLDDLYRLATAKYRIIGSLDPDFPAALADALVLLLIELTGRKLCPEGLVILRRHNSRFNEHAVMPADDFRKLITECATEILVGGENFPRKVKFYDGLRLGKRGKNRESIGTTTNEAHEQFSDDR